MDTFIKFMACVVLSGLAVITLSAATWAVLTIIEYYKFCQKIDKP